MALTKVDFTNGPYRIDNPPDVYLYNTSNYTRVSNFHVGETLFNWGTVKPSIRTNAEELTIPFYTYKSGTEVKEIKVVKPGTFPSFRGTDPFYKLVSSGTTTKSRGYNSSGEPAGAYETYQLTVSDEKLKIGNQEFIASDFDDNTIPKRIIVLLQGAGGGGGSGENGWGAESGAGGGSGACVIAEMLLDSSVSYTLEVGLAGARGKDSSATGDPDDSGFIGGTTRIWANSEQISALGGRGGAGGRASDPGYGGGYGGTYNVWSSYNYFTCLYKAEGKKGDVIWDGDSGTSSGESTPSNSTSWNYTSYSIGGYSGGTSNGAGSYSSVRYGGGGAASYLARGGAAPSSMSSSRSYTSAACQGLLGSGGGGGEQNGNQTQASGQVGNAQLGANGGPGVIYFFYGY